MELEQIYRNELTSPQKREVVGYIMTIKQVGYTQAINLCNGRSKLLPAELAKVLNFINNLRTC